MAEIVNLRLARKAKVRADREAAAQAHRASHGRSKAERTASRAALDKAQRVVDAHRLSAPRGPDEPR